MFGDGAFQDVCLAVKHLTGRSFGSSLKGYETPVLRHDRESGQEQWGLRGQTLGSLRPGRPGCLETKQRRSKRGDVSRRNGHAFQKLQVSWIEALTELNAAGLCQCRLNVERVYFMISDAQFGRTTEIPATFVPRSASRTALTAPVTIGRRKRQHAELPRLELERDTFTVEGAVEFKNRGVLRGKPVLRSSGRWDRAIPIEGGPDVAFAQFDPLHREARPQRRFAAVAVGSL